MLQYLTTVIASVLVSLFPGKMNERVVEVSLFFALLALSLFVALVISPVTDPARNNGTF